MLRHRLTRALGVLGLCVGVAVTSFAARGGAAPVDPAAAVVAAARTHLGEPYVWGGATSSGWDCSGLVSVLWHTVGGVQTVPRVSQDLQTWAVPIPIEQAQPGDLVFFGNPVEHVGLLTVRSESTTASPATVTLRMIDAASSRKGVVERTVWTTGVVRFGRVPRPTMPPVLPWTPAPVPAPTPVLTPPAPLTLPAPTQVLASTPVARAAAAMARAAVGTPDPGDAAFIQRIWRLAGGPVLPTSRATLASAGVPVTFADARIGDLVVFGPATPHVGLYVGNGLMVDASRALGRVVLRAVWTGPGLHLVRLPS